MLLSEKIIIHSLILIIELVNRVERLVIEHIPDAEMKRYLSGFM